MAVSYKLQECKNSKSSYNGQFYAKAVMTDVLDLEGLSERVQRNCSMKKSDVLAVLTELVEVMSDELKSSHTVKLNGLGQFKVSIRGSYAKTEKTFNVGTNIKGYKVNFTPEYTLVKGSTVITNDDGTTWVKQTRTRVNKLTEGIVAKEY